METENHDFTKDACKSAEDAAAKISGANDENKNDDVKDDKSETPRITSFADALYEKIANVLGNSNPDQYLCLTIPGQALAREDFAYDYKNNAPKGPTVEANESNLVNKLFDPCRMTGADSGLTLPYQYRSALDLLTPKLNAKIADAKNKLRELLTTPYPYDFGDGSDKEYTLQEVFFRLYDEYIAEQRRWADVQNNKKEELRLKYPPSSAENNLKYEDSYLEWYETVAQSYLNGINEKMSKVISVFTPNDMKILEGVLDSGSGAELQQARQTLNNTGKTTPDGGTVYPVKLNPTNWFELLDTNFTPVDLLKDPEVLAVKLSSLTMARMKLNARILKFSSQIPSNDEIERLTKNIQNAKKELDEKRSALITASGKGISTIFDAVLDLAPIFGGTDKVPSSIKDKLCNMSDEDKDKLKKSIKDLADNEGKLSKAQENYVNASQKLSDALADQVAANNLKAIEPHISQMKAQLDDICAQIDEVKAQIRLSAAMRSDPDKDNKIMDEADGKQAVLAGATPAGYTQIYIQAAASTLKSSNIKSNSAKTSTYGAHFLFGGGSTSSSEQQAAFEDLTKNTDVQIEIGLNVAKVGIERAWFNPGVFALTKDMYNVGSERISPAGEYGEITDERLKEMSKAEYIFPCYPVAMVIARDISIRFHSSGDISSAFADSVEKHSASGGGFLFFSGSSSSSSSSSESAVNSSTMSNSVTLKFTTPQIIGYYMEATRADKSTRLGSTPTPDGYVSISQFVEAYKKVIDALNEQRRKKQ